MVASDDDPWGKLMQMPLDWTRSAWRLASNRVLAMLAAVCCLLGLALAFHEPQPAQAQTRARHTCDIGLIEIPIEGPRLIWNCEEKAPGPGGAEIRWFAVHLGQHPERGRMILSVLMTAKAAGRATRIHYHPDDTHPKGWDMHCGPSDCRPALAVELR
jgi:hypothetical protein